MKRLGLLGLELEMVCIAIIVSASTYQGELKSLPACSQDSAAIEAIIDNEERYTEKLVINDEKNATAVNDKIYNFLARYEQQNVDEVFFYFSGHGEARDDEFLYLLSDYKSTQRMRTSIVNSHLDDAVRRVGPKLYVKIVDACESGMAYVKEASDAERYQKNKTGFNDVFFFYSSQSNEVSYIDNHLSYFTEGIIKAILEHQVETVKYANIVNYIADYFDLLDFQRPYLVQQGSLNGIFCSLSSSLQQKLSPYIRVLPPVSTDQAKDTSSSIIANVIKDAQSYCNKEEADEILAVISRYFSEARFSGLLSGLYTLESEITDLEALPNRRQIGTFLSRGSSTRSYFARPEVTTETYEKKVPKNIYKNIFSSINRLSSVGTDDADNYTIVKSTRDIVTGFVHTTDTAVPAIHVNAVNNYPNINKGRCYVVPIISETYIALAYCFRRFERSNWTKLRSLGTSEWSFEEALIKDGEAVTRTVDNIMIEYATYLEAPILAKYSITVAEAENAVSASTASNETPSSPSDSPRTTRQRAKKEG